MTGEDTMRNKQTISVIIPTYNSSSYIKRTLDSVLSQNILPDEIVVVDDGSSDNTVERIEEYKMKNKDVLENIRVIRQNNMGAGAARNRAIKEASGEWIAFLDSDDIWMQGKMEAVRTAMEAHPDATIIAHDEYAVDEKDLDSHRLCSLHEVYDESKDLFIQLYEGNFFSTSCMVIKKQIIEKVGGFDESLRSAQDYDLWIRCGMYGKLFYIPEPYEIYVTRGGNITANTYRRYNCEMKICRKYIDELIGRIGLKKTRKIVRKRIFNIHKVGTYLSLKQRKVGVAAKIFIRLIPELCKGVNIDENC